MVRKTRETDQEILNSNLGSRIKVDSNNAYFIGSSED